MSDPPGLPTIRRARGYRLYDALGRRYLDLWQNGGRSLLGHRPARQTTLLKALLSKGLAADLPSVYMHRLERALVELLPGYGQVRVAGSMAAALAMAGAYLGRAVSPQEVADPALGQAEGAQVSLWRPGLEAGADSSPPAVLLPVLPFGLAGAPVAVCFQGSLPAGFPPSEIVSPFLLAGALRGLYDLRRLQPPAWLAEGLFEGLRGWVRRGAYLSAACAPQRYGELFRVFLEQGVLLSPTFPGPSILPHGELSRGELQKMIGLFRRFPGE